MTVVSAGESSIFFFRDEARGREQRRHVGFFPPCRRAVETEEEVPMTTA